jgi:hypothetical protein
VGFGKQKLKIETRIYIESVDKYIVSSYLFMYKEMYAIDHNKTSLEIISLDDSPESKPILFSGGIS